MSNDIWAFVETRADQAIDSSLAVVAEAKRLAAESGGRAVAVVVGDEIGASAAAPARHGADVTITVRGAEYRHYSAEAFTHVLATLLAKHSPAALLLAATTYGSELAARTAARLGAGVVCDVTSLSCPDGGRLVFTKPALGGSLVTSTVIETGVQIATIRSGALRAAEPVDAPAELVDEDISVPEGAVRTELLEFVADDGDGEIALEDADIVIAGGRALGSGESFAVLRDLAHALGPNAAVGSSRPPADAGWVSPKLEIGVSGNKVSPDLYIACGISGASQHLAGMSSSKVVVAINKDPEAPLVGLADYSVVGDLFEIVPALTDAVRRRRG